MSTWTASSVQANGISIHYHRSGGAGLPALLLLHGVTDNGLCWSAVAEALEQRYDVIMPDARGHGRSARLDGQFSVELLADDVAGLIRALELEQPYLWGHSMGATTALALAAAYRDLARAIILEDPPLFARECPASVSTCVQKLRRQQREGFALSREQHLALVSSQSPGWSEAELVAWVDSKPQVDPQVPEHIGAIRAYDWRQALLRITCPILLIIGDAEAGALVRLEVAGEAAQLWRSGEIALMGGAGHSIHRERFGETLQVVERFLGRH